MAHMKQSRPHSSLGLIFFWHMKDSQGPDSDLGVHILVIKNNQQVSSWLGSRAATGVPLS